MDTSMQLWGMCFNYLGIKGKRFPQKTIISINVLEIRAIWLACGTFLLIQDLTIKVLIDSTSVMHCMNR